jgi:uncharacterized membrane-anchored protein
MSVNTLRLALLGIVCVAQLTIPVSKLVAYERTLALGESFRFECEPVDPVDVFRGRYVALSYSAAEVELSVDATFQPGERVYFGVEHGADGFAVLTGPRETPPAKGAFLRTRAGWWVHARVARVDLPFDRYYLPEKLAPETERAYRERTRGETADAYVTVRIRNGRAVLEELYLGGLPVREYLEQESDIPD